MPWDPESISPNQINDLRQAAERAWGEDTRYEGYIGHPQPSAGQCYVTSQWMANTLGGHVGVKDGHFFWVSPDKRYVIDLSGDQYAHPPAPPELEGVPLDEDDEAGWEYEPHQKTWRPGPAMYKRADHPLYRGFRVVNYPDHDRANLFGNRANAALRGEHVSSFHQADLLGPSALQTPQQSEDYDMQAPMPMLHDEPSYDPVSDMTTNEYRWVFANGQLHVSPLHSHEELFDHAGENPASSAPAAVGYVNVSQGHALWQVESNISMRGLHKILSDYSDTVGWDFDGMVGSNGQQLHEDFGPKSSMWYAERNDGHLVISKSPLPHGGRIRIEGKTAYVHAPTLTGAMMDWATDFGYNLRTAEWPGGGDMTDKMKFRENLDLYNRGDTDWQPERDNPDQDLGDHLTCGACGQKFDRLEALRLHERDHEPQNKEEIPDGHFPQLDDFDAPLPFRRTQPLPNWGENIARTVVMPLPNHRVAARHPRFDLYASLFGYAHDDKLQFYGGFRRGQLVGYGAIRLNSEFDDPVERWIQQGQVMPFAQHDPATQKAIYQYMAHDGEAWTPGMTPEQYLDRYGHQPFGITQVPSQELLAAIHAHPEHPNDWLNWYRQYSQEDEGRGVPPESKEVWPVILDRDYGEILQDGWHRAHHYLSHGIDPIPAIYYPRQDERSSRVEPEVLMIDAVQHGTGIGSAILSLMQRHFDKFYTHADSKAGERLMSRCGMVNVKGHMWRWAQGQEPKDMIEAAIPFIYDIDGNDQHKDGYIALGYPGQRTSDIAGKFTPGGIIEGYYEPGGKIILISATNMPYTVRHFANLWYHSFPQMEITSVELEGPDGKTQKLAANNVGSYIKTLVGADQAADNAYNALHSNGGRVYVVGGAVRDALQQREPKDLDLMVAGMPSEQVEHVLSSLPGTVNLTGKRFGVFRYKVGGQEVEVALPRQDKYETARRGEGVITVDHNLPVDKDLERRDFTANSMAVDLDSGHLIDPYQGAADLERNVLRTTHPDSFREDPTRLVRALVAHSRYGLSPDERTRYEMEAHSHLLRGESPDALNKVLDKLFTSGNPAAAIRLAKDTGMLQHLYPEVAENWDFNQNNPHHQMTLGEHLVHVFDNVSRDSGDPDLRLAALYHDVGKPVSEWTDPDTGMSHFYQGPNGQGAAHEVVGAKMLEDRMRALNYPVTRINRATDLVRHHMFPAFNTDKGARRFLGNVGNHADDLLTLRKADMEGKGNGPEYFAARTSVDKMRELVDQARRQQAPTDLQNLAINGSDLISQLGMQSGPAIGNLLRALVDHVIEVPTDNNPQRLLQLAQGYQQALPE